MDTQFDSGNGGNDVSAERYVDMPPEPLVVPDTYAFESRFEATSSVGYPGQVARHVLAHDLLVSFDLILY